VRLALHGYVRRPRKAREIVVEVHRVLCDAGLEDVAIPVRAVADAVDASPSSVASAIDRLRRLGLLELTGGGEWIARRGGLPGQRVPYRYRAPWPPGGLGPTTPLT
jgi:hypothetical protein